MTADVESVSRNGQDGMDTHTYPGRVPDPPLPAGDLVKNAEENARMGRMAAEDPSQRLTFRIAAFLQENPRKQLRVRDVADAMGLRVDQVSGTLQRFAERRTDVVRVSRGFYAYYPGRGKGVIPPSERVTMAKTSGKTASKPEPKQQKPEPPEYDPGPDRQKVRTAYREVPGACTKDGRQVVQRMSDGRVFAIEPL